MSNLFGGKDLDKGNIVVFPYSTVKHQFNDEQVKFLSIDPAVRNYASLFLTTSSTRMKIKEMEFFKIDLCPKFKSGVKGSKMYSSAIYGRLVHMFLDMKEHMNNLDIIVVEKPQPQNVILNAIFRSTIAFFQTFFISSENPPIICGISPKLKGKMFNVKKGTQGNDLKKWSEKKAKKIFKLTKNKKGLALIEELNEKKGKRKTRQDKANDFTDCYLQMLALILITSMKCTLPAETLEEVKVDVKLCDKEAEVFNEHNVL